MLRAISIFCLFGVLLAPLQAYAAETFDRIVAIVNDEIITQTEFNRYLVLVMLGVDQKQELDRETQMQLLEQSVEKKLLMQEAKRLNVTVSEQDVDQAMQSMIVRNNMSLKEFKQKLETAGLMIEDIRTAMRTELTTSELIGREVHSKVIISDAEMQKYYADNIAPNEQQGERVRLSQILLLVKEDFTDEQVGALEARAESLRAQLEAGASFGQMASTYSQWPSDPGDGDLGFSPSAPRFAPGRSGGGYARFVDRTIFRRRLRLSCVAEHSESTPRGVLRHRRTVLRAVCRMAS